MFIEELMSSSEKLAEFLYSGVDEDYEETFKKEVEDDYIELKLRTNGKEAVVTIGNSTKKDVVFEEQIDSYESIEIFYALLVSEWSTSIEMFLSRYDELYGALEE